MASYTLETIERLNGAGDTFGYAVEYRFVADDFEQKGSAAFVSSKHSQAVRMIWDDGAVSPVVDPSRFGEKLSPEWIRRFYNVN